MRYSFHGKVRATGQQVDGFVEAANATQAIDRLADQGIIGVYTVRPEPKSPKNAVILSGEAELEQEEAPPPPQQRPRLDKPHRRSVPAVAAPAPVPALPAPEPVALVPAPVSSGSELVLTQLVDKISALTAQVEKLLARPAQVVYQSGPARGGGGGSFAKKSSRIPSDVQNNTLRDIFQTNLDLRQSLEKLASTASASAGGASANGASGASGSVPAAVKPVANGRDRVIQAQPAA